MTASKCVRAERHQNVSKLTQSSFTFDLFRNRKANGNDRNRQRLKEKNIQKVGYITTTIASPAAATAEAAPKTKASATTTTSY